MYRLTNSASILRVQDGALIPQDESNLDYQAYLAWVALGNEPLPHLEPVAAVPRSVTRAQAIAALIITGKRAMVQQVIDSISDPVQRELAQNDWDNRLTFERDNPRLVAIAGALGIDLNEMFILASQQ